ncbi:MAG: glycosyl hydrolase 115 family protein [Treponema sp.]|nr:glycosyl hydrolase 115 family protein [Treponema sp.]
MNKFIFIVEKTAFEGVKRIAKKVALDFEKVSGLLPAITESMPNNNQQISILFATIGNSPLADKLANEGKFDQGAISGKNEVYQIKFINDAFNGEGKILLVCGSDKRGTIYGMFALSQYIGVSPLHFWGDAEPVFNENMEIKKDIETVSKEPSVKYRGFFINDEWPCFGKWTFGHFGGFTAEMYDHVFELLLRLKGNFMWPAMWSSSFALDGPGSLNEELADIYGIVIGASHHEPCLRASEEWAKVKGPDSVYGNEWNYYTNKKGLLKYWEDALARSGKYEKIITIGMRGEHDSSMLGENASLKDNIDLLKDIIKNQRELIKKHVNPDLGKVRQVLALYKEVEAYFYGSSQAEGLMDWDELDGVICMLCEDNFGFMRTLPAQDIRGRNGGFGMYYHFDYHGGPISYEWMPSASFERTWEQMCMAYDYGIKEIWIVNVGDLKFNEVPLSYFMELAYDFEKWGTSAPNSIDKYTSMWLMNNFPDTAPALREKMARVLHGFIRMNAARRPEALNENIYHPCHYLETDRMLAFAADIDALNEEIYSMLSKNNENAKTAYYSMIYFPAKSSINLLRMHLYAGKNRHYAKQCRKTANDYADLVTGCIEKDRALAEVFSMFRNGKWSGMELEQHIGFVKWNEDNCRYPPRIMIEPAYKPRMAVSRKDREDIYTKAYGSPEKIIIDDFLYAGNDEVILEIANDGIGNFDFVIEEQEKSAPCGWLEISALNGNVEVLEEIVIRCNKQKLASLQPPGGIQTANLLIKDKETKVAVEINARIVDTDSLPSMTFLENNGIIAMEASHFCSKNDVDGLNDKPASRFVELKNYGRSSFAAGADKSGGMKVFPSTTDFSEQFFSENDRRAYLTYRFLIEEAGDYTAEIWTTPVNSVQNKRPLRFILISSHISHLKQSTQYVQPKQCVHTITAVHADFKAGDPHYNDWCQGVLDNIRKSEVSLNFENGIHKISIGAVDSGLILERILIYRKGREPLKSYFGPPESFYVK